MLAFPDAHELYRHPEHIGCCIPGSLAGKPSPDLPGRVMSHHKGISPKVIFVLRHWRCCRMDAPVELSFHPGTIAGIIDVQSIYWFHCRVVFHKPEQPSGQ